jgi:hypothetical protein
MQSKITGLFPYMPHRDRFVLAAAAFLYLTGQLCEALLDWWPHTIECNRSGCENRNHAAA